MKLSFLIYGLAAMIFVTLVGYHFTVQTEAQDEPGNNQQNRRLGEGLPDYDIRTDSSAQASDTLARFRRLANQSEASVIAARNESAAGEQALRQQIPTLEVEYNDGLGIPEVISTEELQTERNTLTARSTARRSDILRGFIKENGGLFGVSPAQADELELLADAKNPEDDLSFVNFKQKINGIPVFQGEIKAGLTKQGEIFRVINNLAPGINDENVSTVFGEAETAVDAAFGFVERQRTAAETERNREESTDQKVKFGEGDWATVAEKIYFPTEPGVARAAWRVSVWSRLNTYLVIVDAESGNLLWRKNATRFQTQAATYNVYANPNAMINAADSPATLSPTLKNPSGKQGNLISRTNISRVGNEGLYSFNQKGWIKDSANTTDGNAVQAGLDRLAPDGVDAAQTGSPFRTFTSNWNPPPGNPAPGGSPFTPDAQRGAVIQAFYVMNLYHDELYRLGFTETYGNFQHENFTGNGKGNDRISVEIQDIQDPANCPDNPQQCVDNANFTHPANFTALEDGVRGKLQVFTWDGPQPDRDGAADTQLLIHEATHGTSERLIGNGHGLSGNFMARGMSEGWSDFYAQAMLSEPTDPIAGIYPWSAYSGFLLESGFDDNYYYGLRRFPLAVLAATGSNDKPHNPLSFRHLNSNCNNELGSIGAFAPNPTAPTGCGSSVHNIGEIWAAALWEVRARFVARLGWANGNRRMLQLVTSAMKTTPNNPTFLQARKALLDTTIGSGTMLDRADVTEGFRLRGMGVNASIQNMLPLAVTENFDAPPALFGVNSTGLNFTATVGSSPQTKTVTATAQNGNQVEYSAAGYAPWLTVTQSGNTFTIKANPANLETGTYEGTVTIVGKDFLKLSYIQVPVTLSVKSPVTVDPQSVNFNGFEGGTNPAEQEVTIKNTSSTAVTVVVSDDAGWLNASPTVVALPAGAQAPIKVKAEMTGLGVSTNHARIKLSVGGIVVREIPARLNINPQTIGVNPVSLSFSVPVGSSNPVNQQLTIINTGNKNLTVSAGDNADWLTALLPTGSISPGQAANSTISVNVGSLGIGTYNAVLKLTDNASDFTRDVPVTLKVVALKAGIGVNPDTLSLTVRQGESSTVSVPLNVKNTGSANLKWSASTDAGWLSINPKIGVVPPGLAETATVTVNTSGLSVGTHQASIGFSAPNLALVMVPVEITILNPEQ